MVTRAERLRLAQLPRFRSDVLAEVNTMDRAPDPLAVAVAAIRHHCVTRPGTPDFLVMLRAEGLADVVLAALHRRGMLA